MIKSLLYHKKPFFWFFFHIGLGVVSAFSPFPLIAFFYAFLLLSSPLLFKKQPVDAPLSYLIVYLSSFELIARMAQTSPFIPYELGKYLLMALLVLGILKGSNKGTIGLVLLLLLLPALFYDFSGQVREVDIRFNLFGAFNVGLAIWYFSKQKFTPQGFHQIINLLTLPLVSALAYTVFKTPDLDSIEFNLGANFATTGGFGSNQVSTAFGLGMLLSFYLWLNQVSISGNRWIDLIIVMIFTFQGLLSFSRGGMIGGALGIAVVLFFMTKISRKSLAYFQFKKAQKYFLPTLLFLGLSIVVANSVTGGNLLLRYQGETAGTLSGNKEKTLNTLTTNRFDIFLSDLELFEEYGLAGVGAGASRYLRKEHNGVVAHVEVSRLIAEHGIFGLLFILGVAILFIKVYKSPNDNLYKSILFAFLVVGWYTTFHAATRTYITPLLIGLSTVYIVYGQGPVSRK